MASNPSTTTQQHIETLEMRGIVKRFPGVLASDHVDFTVKAGEIHALLGENGAGKSTLMKILFGLYKPDAGQVLVNSKPLNIQSPSDAIDAGIGMIHQHFMLVEPFTVAENVALGLPSSRGTLLDLDRVTERISELSEQYGLRTDPQASVWQLSVGEQQRVEILKAVYRNASLLVLDEPTAVLTPQEVDELFVIFRQMAEQGHSLIFISHKLHEVLAISDRITVLRDGRVVKTLPTEGATREELAQLMVGREILLRVDHPSVEPGEVRLKLSDVWAKGIQPGVMALRGVNLEVHSGEILGIAGVSGNGQRELAEVIAGLQVPTQGQAQLEGVDTVGMSPTDLLERGLSYIPEKRMRDGAIKEFTVAENFMMRDHMYPPFSDGVFLKPSLIAAHCDELIGAFNVKTPTRDTLVKSLSGGNIQKLILARELSRQPRVLVAAQPTRGVDIGATEYIHQRLIAQRAEGTATLLISEDLDEVQNLSDRIAVMYEGQIMGVVNRGEATVEELGMMMAGVRRDAGAANESDG